MSIKGEKDSYDQEKDGCDSVVMALSFFHCWINWGEKE
jgi:hypothetical protein